METLQEYIDKHRKKELKRLDFRDYLYKLIDKSKFKGDDVAVYKAAHLTRQNWHTLKGGKIPKLHAILKLVFTLELTNHECKYLLKKAGFTLASDSKLSLIIRYCLEYKIYDFYEVNKMLDENNLDPIFD